MIPDLGDDCCGGAPLLGLAAFRPAPGTSFQTGKPGAMLAIGYGPATRGGRQDVDDTWLALRHRPTVRRDPTVASHAVHIRPVGGQSNPCGSALKAYASLDNATAFIIL